MALKFRKNQLNLENNFNIILNQLLVNGITDLNLINIFKNSNKNAFLPPNLQGLDSCDCILNFTKDSFILENSTLLFMLQIADLKKNNKVLVVGADLGFSLYLISKLASKVVCIEEEQTIIDQTLVNLRNNMINNVEVVLGNFKEGEKEHGPYDVIMVNGAFNNVKSGWVNSLKPEGCVIGVERKNNLSNIIKYNKKDNSTQYFKHCNTGFLKSLAQDDNFNF